MKKSAFLIVLCALQLLPLTLQAQTDPYDQRGVQFATQGTDFWVCFPRTRWGSSANMARLYVVAERDCDVTVEGPLLGYSQTYHIMRRRMCGPDTNYIEVPYYISGIMDTVILQNPLVYDYDYTSSISNRPQPKGFHVTSTDTISLFLWVHAAGTGDACNVLPTEMLRDDYVMQLPLAQREVCPMTVQQDATFDIVATQDSTVIDFVLTDWDWLNRHPGDTVRVTLNRGEVYHMAAGEVREKYYPTFEPYWGYLHPVIIGSDTIRPPCDIDPTWRTMARPNHCFAGGSVNLDTFYVDLSGIRIRSHDCKPIAIFEGGGRVYLPYTGLADFLVEQSVPVRYEGKEFLIPNIDYSDTDYIRITGLYDSTTITIRDASRYSNAIRTLTVNAYQTEWFSLCPGEGPFYITTSQPAVVKCYLQRSSRRILGEEGGGPAFYAVKPVEWWHNGVVNYGTITDVDANHNRQTRHHSLYLFTRTDDISSLLLDDYRIDTCFQPIPSTPYSYAHFAYNRQFNSEGTHRIRSTTEAKFMAVMASAGPAEQSVFNLPHAQPSHAYLKVNEVYADSLPPDSIWCMYDPITFRSWAERPADSVFWDFGDGTTRAYSHLDSGFSQPQVYTYHDTGCFTVTCIFTYEYEGCFTIHPDTLIANIHIRNHFDSAFSVHLCEGTYTFRGHLLEYTDTHYITTYWTPSGCDTLWQIDFVTCPHCTYYSDTISTEDVPWIYQNISFGHEVHDEPIHLNRVDDCDSIILYTLVIIPYWGEPPLDSLFILAPNVITLTQEENNRFQLYCSPHIQRAEVMVFNRMGTRVAQFDGLTESWDGTSQGRLCHQGTYVYYVRYIDNRDNNWKTLKGTVTLLY